MLTGGQDFISQSKIIEQVPHVIIGTPGRIFDLIQENGILRKFIRNLKILALDEFDRLQDPSLLTFIQRGLRDLIKPKQFILTTSTFKET